MATYKDMQDRVALDYLNLALPIQDVKRGILRTIAQYENQRFFFNETATALACSAGQSFVNVPSDFLFLDRLEVVRNSISYALVNRSFDEIRAYNAVGTRNQPTDYAYRGDRFELSAIPDSAYPVNVYYVQKLTTLSADSDTNAWTNEAANLIGHAACVELLSTVLVSDTNRVNRHVIAAQAALSELNLRNVPRLTTKLRQSTF